MVFFWFSLHKPIWMVLQPPYFTHELSRSTTKPPYYLLKIYSPSWLHIPANFYSEIVRHRTPTHRVSRLCHFFPLWFQSQHVGPESSLSSKVFLMVWQKLLQLPKRCLVRSTIGEKFNLCPPLSGHIQCALNASPAGSYAHAVHTHTNTGLTSTTLFLWLWLPVLFSSPLESVVRFYNIACKPTLSQALM